MRLSILYAHPIIIRISICLIDSIWKEKKISAVYMDGLNKKLSWKYIYFAFLSKNQHVNIYHNKEIVVYLIPKI